MWIPESKTAPLSGTAEIDSQQGNQLPGYLFGHIRGCRLKVAIIIFCSFLCVNAPCSLMSGVLALPASPGSDEMRVEDRIIIGAEEMTW